ncbi:hypothetical protein [Gordonia sp. MP11Mi]|uniref:Uncharacterized protein n=1 Tax=Gordonia sp. MP11Mi TaxID=3022769 RepID=A0AA97CYR3_9ACTN
MGTYDSVLIDGVEWQTKALGKRLRTSRPGDAVEVEHVAATDEEVAQASTFAYAEVPGRYTIEVMATARLLIEDGKVVGLVNTTTVVPADAFDYHGRDEHDRLAHIFGEQRPRRTMHIAQPPVPPRPRRPRQ